MHYRFYHPFVYWEKIKNHEQLKRELLPKIYEDIQKNEKEYLEKLVWDCEVITSFPNTDYSDSFLRLDRVVNSIVWDPFDRMLDEVKPEINIDSADLDLIWYNFYQVGHNQEIHDHRNDSTFSGIYLLSIDEPNSTVFYNASDKSEVNEYFNTDKLEEGSVILFPAHLPHYVKPCKTNGRITLSFNIKCE